MDKLDMDSRRHFFWLALWRGLLGLVALYAVVEKPLSAVLVSFAVLGILLLVGEGIYRYGIYLERQRRYEERQRELRQQRQEDARLRFEEMQAQQKGRRAFTSLEEDDDAPGANAPMSLPAPGFDRKPSKIPAGTYSQTL